jgi:hypothetical protein
MPLGSWAWGLLLWVDEKVAGSLDGWMDDRNGVEPEDLGVELSGVQKG